jgi:tight adherence protein B
MTALLVVAMTLAAVAALLWPSRRPRQTPPAPLAPPTDLRELERGNRARWMLGRLRASPTVDVVPMMDALGAALEAGLSAADALRMAHHVADPAGWLVPLVQAADEGRPLGHLWRRLARRMGHPDLTSLAQAWTISERLGAPVAEAVATAAATARARTSLTLRLSAATAGARATSAMLTVLPVGGLVLTLLLGLTPADLYATPAAGVSALAGVLLLLFGRWMVRRMTARVQATVSRA